MAKGFACMKDGEIDIRTVQHSEVGAMVNGLVLYGVGLPLRSMPDDAVRELFRAKVEETFDVHCVPVVVAVDAN